MLNCKVNSFIRGYHAYKCRIGSHLRVKYYTVYGEREPDNQAQPENAVAIKKEGMVVGHPQDEACRAVSILLLKGGTEILPGQSLKFNPLPDKPLKKYLPPAKGSKKIPPPLTRGQKNALHLLEYWSKNPEMYQKCIFQHFRGKSS